MAVLPVLDPKQLQPKINLALQLHPVLLGKMQQHYSNVLYPKTIRPANDG